MQLLANKGIDELMAGVCKIVCFVDGRLSPTQPDEWGQHGLHVKV